MERERAFDVKTSAAGSPAYVGGRSAPPRVLIVSHIRLYRESLARVLRAFGIEQVSTAPVASAMGVLGCDPIDVAMLDFAARDMSATTRRIAQEYPSVRVVAFGIDDDPDDILACADAGVAGFLERDSGPEELLTVLESVRRDELVCSPRAAAILLRRHATRPADAVAAPAMRLTPREREVLDHVAQGLSNKEIAASMHLGLTTVKNHVHAILEKLHVQRRGAAAAILRGARRSS